MKNIYSEMSLLSFSIVGLFLLFVIQIIPFSERFLQYEGFRQIFLSLNLIIFLIIAYLLYGTFRLLREFVASKTSRFFWRVGVVSGILFFLGNFIFVELLTITSWRATSYLVVQLPLIVVGIIQLLFFLFIVGKLSFKKLVRGNMVSWKLIVVMWGFLLTTLVAIATPYIVFYTELGSVYPLPFIPIL